MTAIGLVVSCGSRTGLFGPEPGLLADSGTDAPADENTLDANVSRDANRDVSSDAQDAAIDGPLACVPGTFGFNLATPQLMFVLDRSGSMDFSLTSNGPPPAAEPTRWITLRDSLAQAIVPFSGQIAMGARFFPARTADGFDPVAACVQDPIGLAIAPALGNANAILDTFGATAPVGGTPTAVAIDLATAQIASGRGLARAMVVATDGAPNCNTALDRRTCECTSIDPSSCFNSPTGASNCLDDVRSVAAIQRAVALGIPVYVVGIGVTASFAGTLDAMAIAGSRPRAATPRYYPAETPAELTQAFTVVRDSVARCSYITPSSPTDPDAITVTVGGAAVARDATRVDGWDWIDQSYGYLQLFGPTCDRATPANVAGTITCRDD